MGLPDPLTQAATLCHDQPVEYFTLAAKPGDPRALRIEEALREAWTACAAQPCTKCHVPARQYCRDRTAGVHRVVRFHRPRQDDAGVPAILGPVGIGGLSWAKGKGSFEWDNRPIPTV